MLNKINLMEWPIEDLLREIARVEALPATFATEKYLERLYRAVERKQANEEESR